MKCDKCGRELEEGEVCPCCAEEKEPECVPAEEPVEEPVEEPIEESPECVPADEPSDEADCTPDEEPVMEAGEINLDDGGDVADEIDEIMFDETDKPEPEPKPEKQGFVAKLKGIFGKK